MRQEMTDYKNIAANLAKILQRIQSEEFCCCSDELIEEINTALTAYEQAIKAGGDGWLPISSAPKDGSSIWVSHPTTIRSDIKTIEREVFWRDGAWFVPYNSTPLHDGHEPTHWMPLPQPPLNQGESDAN